jgi:UDP-N-acetylglucosamine--N-acetylmuramyl-(pentapeptide) pyrophosphoryl-undecaprenol N-acetylglucosamine transferase
MNRDVTTVAGPVVLLCTSNGVGLGHLARMMAVARALEPDARPVIFTLSAAVAVPVAQGFEVEHLPSAGHAGLASGPWQRLLEDRVDHLVERLQPRVVMFDGVHPYPGLVSALAGHRRRLRRVWQRRAMWKPGIGAESLAAERFFDHVVEPGEYAAAVDTGLTVERRTSPKVHPVAPIVYDAGHLDRTTACAELGLDVTASHVLVQLGAGAINDVSSLTGAVVAEVLARGAVPVVARSELSVPDPAADGDVPVIRRFPLSRWFAAFDGAVLAAGYNSFHEALALRLPSVFVPNLVTRTDDQEARARHASEQGWAWRWDGSDRTALAGVIEALTDADSRGAVRDRLAALPPATGATGVAALLRSWL